MGVRSVFSGGGSYSASGIGRVRMPHQPSLTYSTQTVFVRPGHSHVMPSSNTVKPRFQSDALCSKWDFAAHLVVPLHSLNKMSHSTLMHESGNTLELRL